MVSSLVLGSISSMLFSSPQLSMDALEQRDEGQIINGIC